MIKARWMRWAKHIARMGGKEEYIQNIGGKARRKKNTRKTKWVDWAAP
jgi:hypothetical protein